MRLVFGFNTLGLAGQSLDWDRLVSLGEKVQIRRLVLVLNRLVGK